MPSRRPSRAVVAAEHPDHAEFREAVLDGLAEPQKSIPSKYLYDREGSRLFDAITRLPEYYLTRTEEGLLSAARTEIAELIGPHAEIIEFGAGSLHKVRILLQALRTPASFVPIDISREHLAASARELRREFPNLAVSPVVGDFGHILALPAWLERGRRVGFFPGSTIGNFTPDAAAAFLRHVARIVGIGGGLLIGVDTCKDPDVLRLAYDDRAGVTAAFNRNVLTRINRELGGTFVPAQFAHWAPYNSEHSRVEMHLIADRQQIVQAAGGAFSLRRGESIHTENSYKYAAAEFLAMATKAGFAVEGTWADPNSMVMVNLLRVVGQA